MSASDGRIVTNFICQALTGRPLTVYGDGRQTRSFATLTTWSLARRDDRLGGFGPGSSRSGSSPGWCRRLLAVGADRVPSAPVDDPTRRCPVIGVPRSASWKPETPVEVGVRKTAEWFSARQDELGSLASGQALVDP
jgi:nucleoside-diphosphate-sugar epimerase